MPIGQEALLQQQREEELNAALEVRFEKSVYDTFVYLMEDLRNDHIKIGYSKTPEKRERTLQSEQPEMVLRFAIPAEKEEEWRLHNRFAASQVRGEWFDLNACEVYEAITYLMACGDEKRVVMDHEWFGGIAMANLMAKG